MSLIDRDTVQRILDTADIVDVVSDFVTLKRRGQNYVGLCPFHNDRSPSFYVSRAKGICKCFSCGESASAVGFIMKHESLTYVEALKYLAKKYGIEVKERELTDSERAEANARESLLAVNEFAIARFERNLADTPDGRDIGMSYLRQRGISAKMIERFRLGYALDRSDDVYASARSAGFADQALADSGLCVRTDRGTWYDRFRGRVIFPVFSVSGRVVAFGGRTLRKEKTIAKYVNSPESVIYSKSRELYGLYQARAAIGRQDKCILVEGYMDVISMHQAGVENVVASSGTSLTEGQIRLIARFTKNVTIIYDSDAAGIKASLRGINLLLAQGLNIKVVLLPDGDDPDSFAQSHSSTEVEEYIRAHEVDFIRFKTDILLTDAGADPIERARVISNIVESIAVIPDAVTRAVYLQECARRLDIDEKVLSLQVSKATAQAVEQRQQQRERERAHQELGPHVADVTQGGTANTAQSMAGRKDNLEMCRDTLELTVMRYVLRYGMLPIDDAEPPMLVADYIRDELARDGITFTNPAAARMHAAIEEHIAAHWEADIAAFLPRLDAEIEAMRREGIDRIAREGKSAAEMEQMEETLAAEIEAERARRDGEFRERYLQQTFISHPDDQVRELAARLVADPYRLSTYHERYAHVPSERERLVELVPRAVHELKYLIVRQKIADVKHRLAAEQVAAEQIKLMKEQQRYVELRKQLAVILGERTFM